MMKKLFQKIQMALGLKQISDNLEVLKELQVVNFIKTELRLNPRYKNKKMLTHFERQYFSQFGEDGIIQEIFRRIGTSNKLFVEIGSSDGLENNTTHLLLNGWKGLWIEADDTLSTKAKQYFSSFITTKQLKVLQFFVTAKNIDKILKIQKIAKDLDFLSIDIDGNDYWIWESLKTFKPRVICIEYNPSLGPSLQWEMSYQEDHSYDNTNYHGASLKSLEKLGKQLGYTLVGCSLAGVNAFFVRNDLVKSKFVRPFTSEHHFESAKYYLNQKTGHPKSGKMFKDFQIEK